MLVQSPVPNAHRWFRFDGTFSFGNMLIILGLLGTSYAGYVRNSERMEIAIRDIASLQRGTSEQAERAAQALADQARANRDQLKENAERFQSIILGLQGTMGENIRRVEERMGRLEGSLEARRDSLDQRLEAAMSLGIQNRADLAALQRSSAISLPGSPAVRQR
jgi:predicted  nucleic acid-binding Zn-ribbon protein